MTRQGPAEGFPLNTQTTQVTQQKTTNPRNPGLPLEKMVMVGVWGLT